MYNLFKSEVRDVRKENKNKLMSTKMDFLIESSGAVRIGKNHKEEM